jgi:hypothetical protein
MGYLGFLFEVDSVEKVVFVSSEIFEKNIVIGIKDKVQLTKINSAKFLSKELELKEFPIFKSAKFIYSKLCVAKETFVDFEHLTIWFNSKKYKELRQLFEEEIKDETEMIIRVIAIYEYFN